MTLLEKAAEAVRQTSREKGFIVHERYLPDVVRATITAIREVSDEMIREIDYDPSDLMGPVSFTGHKLLYQLVIDAILKE